MIEPGTGDPNRRSTRLVGVPPLPTLLLFAIAVAVAGQLLQVECITPPKQLISFLSGNKDQLARESRDQLHPKLRPLLELEDTCGTIDYCGTLVLLARKSKTNAILIDRRTSRSRDFKLSKVKTAALNGYLVQSYTCRTMDNYELTLHRIIHPEDIERGRPEPGAKKPYILLHGPIGSSASFLANVKEQATPRHHATPNDDNGPIDNEPPQSPIGSEGGKPMKRSIDLLGYLDRLLKHRKDDREDRWSSVAVQFEGIRSLSKKSMQSTSTLSKFFKLAQDQEYSDFELVNFDNDQNDFGTFYRRQYRKSDLPKEAKEAINESLALTMSNFGHDVWLLNLRGNSYSRNYHGPLNPLRDAEYWDFNSSTLVREDLLASINFIRRQTSQFKGTLGLISYSYSSALVLHLLTRYPEYADLMQPIVMIAPGPMTASHERGVQRKIMATTIKRMVAQTGPFPGLGRKGDDLLMRAVCALPFAKNLCNLFEIMLHGQLTSMSRLVISNAETSAIQRDAACGQTSTPVLRDIMSHISAHNVQPDYSPSLADKHKKALKRTVMLVHSTEDSISSPRDVKNIRESALKSMALVDYVIHEPDFTHTSFLFSERNRYLVNGEIVRMVALFDLLTLPLPAKVRSEPAKKLPKIHMIEPLEPLEPLKPLAPLNV